MYRLIVVDDEVFVRQCVVKGIEWQKFGFTVAGEASNGLAALKLMEEIRPQLVVTDIRMPDMDGIELLKRIHSAYSDTQVIILSAYDDFAYAQQAVRWNAAGYLLKPVNPDEMREAVAKVLGRLEKTREPGFQQPSYSISEKARLFIMENYMQRIALEDVAKFCSVNKSYLSREFKAETGATVVDYITSLRLRKACELLLDADHAVAAVAAMVGYEDYTYFCRIFKKEFGITPLQYKMNRNLGRK